MNLDWSPQHKTGMEGLSSKAALGVTHVIDNLFKDMVEWFFVSKKDLEDGYYQCLMDPKSRKYTAFTCELGLFEWTRMPMGLKYSGLTFYFKWSNKTDQVKNGSIV